MWREASKCAVSVIMVLLDAGSTSSRNAIPLQSVRDDASKRSIIDMRLFG